MSSGERPRSSVPPTRTLPLRAFTSPEMARTSVVLPAPLAPSTAVMLPSATLSDTLFTATTPP